MKTKIPYKEALSLAEELLCLLRPSCQRIEVAGSLRRRRPEVGDIELVCIPKPQEDLFGEMQYYLFGIDQALEKSGLKRELDGPRQKRIKIGRTYCDLFITTPEKWGVIFTIRTGDSEFSRALVTSRQQGGLRPQGMCFHKGNVYQGNYLCETPGETDVFRVLGLPWLPPDQRQGIPKGYLKQIMETARVGV